MSLIFSGLPGFGMINSREDWKGPISSSRVLARKGPMYLPLSSSFWMTFLNSCVYSIIDSLFGGVCVTAICGKSKLKPNRRPSGILVKRSSSPAHWSSHSHASTLYRVNGASFLRSRAFLGSMGGCSTP
jgi:hypothetical protein